MKRLTSCLVVLGALTMLGGQARAGWLPACTQAQVDLEAEELRVDGNFRWCPHPSVWLGQANGTYENLGAPVDWSDEFVLADLTGATVVAGATQKVVVKCHRVPRCQIDVAVVEEGSEYPAPVEQTGQTATMPLDPAPTGLDGDLQTGVTWPNPRFTDNGDGTVTDNLTGLIWLQNADCFGQKDWATALTDANTLNTGECGLSDDSEEGDWRLPNIKELQSLVHFGVANPALPDTAGTGQWTDGDPFSGVQPSNYWSSTSYADNTSNAWVLILYSGYVVRDDKSDTYYVWPVRGGQ